MIKPADDGNNITTMKALVFHGPNSLALEDRPKPTIVDATDAIVRITTTTIRERRKGTRVKGGAQERERKRRSLEGKSMRKQTRASRAATATENETQKTKGLLPC